MKIINYKPGMHLCKWNIMYVVHVLEFISVQKPITYMASFCYIANKALHKLYTLKLYLKSRFQNMYMYMIVENVNQVKLYNRFFKRKSGNSWINIFSNEIRQCLGHKTITFSFSVSLNYNLYTCIMLWTTYVSHLTLN